jgi:hypothetical protein
LHEHSNRNSMGQPLQPQHATVRPPTVLPSPRLSSCSGYGVGAEVADCSRCSHGGMALPQRASRNTCTKPQNRRVAAIMCVPQCACRSQPLPAARAHPTRQAGPCTGCAPGPPGPPGPPRPPRPPATPARHRPRHAAPQQPASKPGAPVNASHDESPQREERGEERVCVTDGVAKGGVQRIGTNASPLPSAVAGPLPPHPSRPGPHAHCPCSPLSLPTYRPSACLVPTLLLSFFLPPFLTPLCSLV